MEIVHADKLTKYIKAVAPGTWGKVDIDETGAVILRVSAVKIMESIVNLGFNPARKTEVTGRVFTPISHTRPFRIRPGIGHKFLTPIEIDPKIIEEYPGYKIGYIVSHVPGISAKLGLVYSTSIVFLDDVDNCNVELSAMATRRITIDDYAELARIYFVRIPVMGEVETMGISIRGEVETIGMPPSFKDDGSGLPAPTFDIPDNIEFDEMYEDIEAVK